MKGIEPRVRLRAVLRRKRGTNDITLLELARMELASRLAMSANRIAHMADSAKLCTTYKSWLPSQINRPPPHHSFCPLVAEYAVLSGLVTRKLRLRWEALKRDFLENVNKRLSEMAAGVLFVGRVPLLNSYPGRDVKRGVGPFKKPPRLPC